uniref:Tyrosine specific protein phosphatases domain-containing protein n=1 Tax=viral metagenome TaxID=1070528 RepID=A0A6C0CCD6_9ZZZZ
MHTSWEFVKNPNTEYYRTMRIINDLICQLNYLSDKIHREPNATHILNNIWLGNMEAACDFNFVTKNKIMDIMNVTPDGFDNFGFITYHRYPIKDENINKNLAHRALDTGAAIIHKCVRENRPILIHCKRGHHRSATIIMYYLMKYLSFDLSQAIIFIKRKRPKSFRRVTHFLQFLVQK